MVHWNQSIFSFKHLQITHFAVFFKLLSRHWLKEQGRLKLLWVTHSGQQDFYINVMFQHLLLCIHTYGQTSTCYYVSVNSAESTKDEMGDKLYLTRISNGTSYSHILQYGSLFLYLFFMPICLMGVYNHFKNNNHWDIYKWINKWMEVSRRWNRRNFSCLMQIENKY